MPALKWVSRITCLQNHTNSSPVFIKPFFFFFAAKLVPAPAEQAFSGQPGGLGLAARRVEVTVTILQRARQAT